MYAQRHLALRKPFRKHGLRGILDLTRCDARAGQDYLVVSKSNRSQDARRTFELTSIHIHQPTNIAPINSVPSISVPSNSDVPRPMIFSLEKRHAILAGDNFVAHDATVMGAVTLRHGTSVWFKNVIRGDLDGIRIGEPSNIQDACVLHVDIGMPLEVGDAVSVGHQAVLHGCTVKDGAQVGINAVVLDGAVVGEQALSGTNTLGPPGKGNTTTDVGAGSTGSGCTRFEPGRDKDDR